MVNHIQWRVLVIAEALLWGIAILLYWVPLLLLSPTSRAGGEGWGLSIAYALRIIGLEVVVGVIVLIISGVVVARRLTQHKLLHLLLLIILSPIIATILWDYISLIYNNLSIF